MQKKGEGTWESVLPIVAAILVIAALFGGCGEQSERNRIGSSIDWGDGFYWNSSSESVERTPWG